MRAFHRVWEKKKVEEEREEAKLKGRKGLSTNKILSYVVEVLKSEKEQNQKTFKRRTDHRRIDFLPSKGEYREIQVPSQSTHWRDISGRIFPSFTN